MSQNVQEEPKEQRNGESGNGESRNGEGVNAPASGAPPLPAQRAKTGIPLRPATPPAKSGKTTGLQKAAGFARTVAPLIQKVLPLLEGNVAGAVTNLLTSRDAAPRVNLEPLESAVTRMRKDHIDLRLSVADQNAALKRVADQIESVKDSVERNGLEARELRQDVQQLRKTVNLFIWIGLILLVISIVINIAFFVQIEHLAR